MFPFVIKCRIRVRELLSQETMTLNIQVSVRDKREARGDMGWGPRDG
jgi:hypothetical protein